MVSGDPLVPVTKLRIKFGSQGAHKSFQQPSVINECAYQKLCGGSDWSTKGAVLNVNNLMKRGREELSEDRPKKKQKMEPYMSRRCSMVLRSLMNHRYGWPFNQPVDPVKLNIPDYFSIISKPMDLGTIKSRLAKNVYIFVEEFAADVRLTFSNAMLYNPTSNDVHQMAKTLSEIFEGQWRSLEKKWNSDGVPRDFSSETRKYTEKSQDRPDSAALSEVSTVKKSKPVEEKVKKVSFDMRPKATTSKVKLSKQDVTNAPINLMGKGPCKGTTNGGKHDFCFNGANQPLNSVPFSHGTSSDSTCACSSDITWEKSCGDNGSDASSVSVNVKNRARTTPVAHLSESNLDLNGAVSSMDDDIGCPSSNLKVSERDAGSDEGLETRVSDVQMSPNRALRAAMLKSRFADTILKAKQRTLLDHSTNKADPVKLQQEKEKLEKKHLEEKARIEADIRAAEASMRMKEELERKAKLDIEREAARLALQKMEETVEIVENFKVEKELRMLCGSNPGNAKFLEELGLFKKDEFIADDDMEDDKVLDIDGEEGEIFS